MASRAGIVVTGTEVLTGRVPDRNGPWLAEQLRIVGVDTAEVIVVGDRPDDLRWSLRALADQGLDLLITTGGLGPTADDLTAEIVGEVQGRPSFVDAELERQIGAIVARLSAERGWQLDAAATADSVRKQALVPAGASVLSPVGTAPGLVVPIADDRTGPPVVVLPGPPPELQAMWPLVLADATVQSALAGRSELAQQTLRLWGTSESEIAATLRELGTRLDGLEITTCLRDGELEIVTRFGPSAQDRYDSFAAAIGERYPKTLFSTDGRTVDDLVADRLIEKNLTIATAESCTAGMLAARLTDRAGSSAYLLGGLVVYSNAAKQELAGVSKDLLDQVGAVSTEVAVALAEGARDRLHADLGVGITGIAGPGGATPGKPIGLVHLCVSGKGRTMSRRILVPGSRAAVRTRSTVAALHLIRQLLTE
ncbi:MAG: nicotinamide-nucleotide amidase [Pseudonocardiales bacterium]|jgi:nicotinamide-nucleotide amidase|nr:nicotinamide-nucleotide amidase [Pseudonocardiales bacterium]